MMKLIYPDGMMTDEEAYELIDFAAEGRKRVKDQLYIIDETFMAEPAKFVYQKVKTGEEVPVETLENISNGMAAEPTSTAVATEESKEQSTSGKRPRIPILAERSRSFRLGQTGVTYRELFADYLHDAQEITVEDPYIRTSWQVKNFVDFCTMLIETRLVEGLQLHLVTNEEEAKTPDLIDRLDDIKDDLALTGIEFDYKIRDFHDRTIKTDTGWTIMMGRGLDIYEKYSPYSVAANKQELRKCKEFMVTYLKNKS
jgi:ATP-dependent Lon protease